MSYADYVFYSNCNKILREGFSDISFDVRPKWSDGAPAHTIKLLYVMNRYDLSKIGVPVMTLRKNAFKSCIDEILWIYQKHSNNIRDLNSHIWDSWADDTGSIGKAYGYQMSLEHKYAEGMFTQIDRVIWDLKNNPGSRSIMTNLYNHADLSEMHLRPCAYSMTFNVTKDSDGNMVLNGMLNQRSQDMLTANNWNVVQYSVLLHMLAQVCGMRVGEFVHVIADAHIYDRHIPIIDDMIHTYDVKLDEIICGGEFTREHRQDIPYPNPKFWMNPDIHDFYKFTTDDFKLSDYQYIDNKYTIEVAI